MNKRFLFTVGVLLGGVLITSCVSPFYGTARIEKGWHADIGVAGMTLLYPSLDSRGFNYIYGGRTDAGLSYGLNDYFQVNGRIALGLAGWIPVFADGGLGVQAALPLGQVIPALQSELSYYGGGVTFSPGLLLGFGKRELITIGGRVHIFGNSGDDPHPEYGPYLDPFPIDCFVGIHLGRWNFFAGSQMFYHSSRYSFERPVATLGVGYKLK